MTQIDNRTSAKATKDRWEQTSKDRAESKKRNSEKRARGEKVRGGGRGWWSVKGRGREGGRQDQMKMRVGEGAEFEEIDIDVSDASADEM